MRLLLLLVIAISSSYALSTYVSYTLVLLGLISSISTYMILSTIIFIIGSYKSGK